jgi:hypothetical protein
MLQFADPVSIRDEVARLVERLEDAREDDRGSPSTQEPSEQQRLTDALANVLDALQQRERGTDRESGGREPTLGDLGDHAIDLLARLAEIARRMQMSDEADALYQLIFPLACCVARGGGELTHIGLVVNAAAAHADALRGPAEFAVLFRMTDDVFHAVSPRVSDAPAGSDTERAWRLLIINRAVVATRTHQPALMKRAFDTLIEFAPDDAAGFFRQGMEQMESLEYPAAARRVMQSYYDAEVGDRRLH